MIKAAQKESGARRGNLHSVVITMIALVVVLNCYAPAGPTITERVYGSAIILIGAIGIREWMRRRDGEIPFIPFFCGFYVIYFSVPIFIADQFMRDFLDRDSGLSDASLEGALLLDRKSVV